MLLHLLLVHTVQSLHRQFNILDQRIASASREIFAHDHAHELQLLAVRRHRVRGHDPAPLAELMRDGELVVVMTLGRIQSERDEREALATGLAHEDEAELFETGGEVVRGAGQIGHDAAVTLLSQADHLVVLSDDLGGALGEVEGEGCLVCAEVVDVEDEFLG